MFLYAFYLKIEPFLPWTILRFIFSFRNSFSPKEIFFFKPFPNLIVQSLVWSAPAPDPLREIEDYCLYFDNQYGPNHPPFYRGRLLQVGVHSTAKKKPSIRFQGTARCPT